MPVSAIPGWALLGDWEEDGTRFFQVDRTTSLTIRVLKPYGHLAVQIYARLFVNEAYVAAAKILGSGNILMPQDNVLCNIEVHPDHRGHHYSVRLMELVQRQIGVVYRTGLMSKSGFANTKYLGLLLVPGREMTSRKPSNTVLSIGRLETSLSSKILYTRASAPGSYFRVS